MIVIGYQGIGKSTLVKDNNSYIDFEKLLNTMGYEVKYRYNVLTIRRDLYKKV